jgi:hypothetical protein
MTTMHRTNLQEDIVKALIESKAINFEAAGSVIAKYGAAAALEGSGLYVNINHRVMDACIPVFNPGVLNVERFEE